MAKAKSAGLAFVSSKGHTRSVKDKHGNPKTVSVKSSVKKKPSKKS